MGFHLHTISG